MTRSQFISAYRGSGSESRHKICWKKQFSRLAWPPRKKKVLGNLIMPLYSFFFMSVSSASHIKSAPLITDLSKMLFRLWNGVKMPAIKSCHDTSPECNCLKLGMLRLHNSIIALCTILYRDFCCQINIAKLYKSQHVFILWCQNIIHGVTR